MMTETIIRTADDFRQADAAGAWFYIRHTSPHRPDSPTNEGWLREAAANHNNGLSYYEQTTARELLDSLWYITPDTLDTPDAEDSEAAAWIVALADAHGWDTPLYRADYLGKEGEYTASHIDELDALIAWCNHDADQLIAVFGEEAE